jgi:hypothetical protein
LLNAELVRPTGAVGSGESLGQWPEKIYEDSEHDQPDDYPSEDAAELFYSYERHGRLIGTRALRVRVNLASAAREATDVTRELAKRTAGGLFAFKHYHGFCNSSGSFAILAAIRRAGRYAARSDGVFE